MKKVLYFLKNNWFVALLLIIIVAIIFLFWDCICTKMKIWFQKKVVIKNPPSGDGTNSTGTGGSETFRP